MDTDAVFVNIREIHQHLDSLHLVSHFGLSALFVDGFFKLGTAVLCSSIILNVNQITSLSHIHFPSAQFSHEGVFYHL